MIRDEELTEMLLSDDFWNSKRKLTKKERRLRRKSMLIPKPKFKVGDVVKDKYKDEHYIYECSYNLTKNIWSYLTYNCDTFYESELKLVETEL